MPEKYKAFKYFYLDEMTYEEMIEEYGYAERTPGDGLWSLRTY